MVSADVQSMIRRAKSVYAERLQSKLEESHRDQYVAIEPDSGDHFLADSFDEAVKMARQKYPTRLSHVIRIGHRAALHMGGLTR